MTTQLYLGDIAVDVVLKDIKNVHLSVYPPTGRVRISAPIVSGSIPISRKSRECASNTSSSMRWCIC